MQNFKHSYDEKEDDLFLYNSNSKSKGSIEIGDLIIDFNSKKEIVAIQILNASQFIKDFSTKNIKLKEILNNLTSVKINIINKKNLMLIKLFLTSNNKEINPIISIPNITTGSPAIA